MGASAVEKVFCVLEFSKAESVITVPQHFRSRFGKELPYSSIKWHGNLKLCVVCAKVKVVDDRPYLKKSPIESNCHGTDFFLDMLVDVPVAG
ncbi:hypothetical protein TNCV_4133741 [Trichonephila clavipes]|uniref:Uncharacterized protein n=1 Tax=Trichonephila clavipes TaxID=2585209 RepID=A0A8X6V7I9_TRICX|nr:hypothetical protein TNCV_4133741 [Trichonephila clavipes]